MDDNNSDSPPLLLAVVSLPADRDDQYLYNGTALDDLFDCTLSRDKMEELLAPPTESWASIPSTNYKTKITEQNLRSGRKQRMRSSLFLIASSI